MDMNIAAGESWLVRLCKAVEELGDATYLALVEVGEGELVVKMICSILLRVREWLLGRNLAGVGGLDG